MSLIFSVNLKRLRKSRGISQAELIEKSGASSVAMIEAGRRENPSLSTMQKIARFFGVTIDELCREELTELEEMAGRDE